MTLKDRIMARKGYWLRNGAILTFGLTLFFFVMLPRRQPNLDNKVNIDPEQESRLHSAPSPSAHSTPTSPKSFTTWPNDITSEHCTLAHPRRPLIQYVLMIDAGSTGSRIHVYRFNYCKETPELEDELFEQIQPGLSYYDDNAEGAAKSLDSLLDTAVKEVPAYLHRSTPVAVKATAGLRLLGEYKSNKILAAVRNRLETKYPFPIIKDQGVAVMDGSDEGVYAWVTVNYLLRRISTLAKASTVAVLDLGGASTQIVFEPKAANGVAVSPGKQRVPMNFNGNEYVLFQHSYLGYGLNEARKQINSYVIDNPIDNTNGIALQDGEFLHPCMPVDSRQPFVHEDMEVTLVGVSDPGGECRRVVQAIFYKHKACSQAPCSFNGVYQPSLTNSFGSDIYAFSYIFDRISPFLRGSDTPTQDMTLEELEHLTDRVCVADETAFKEFDGITEAKNELDKISEMCMDLSYIHGLLAFAYGLPKERSVTLAKKINNYETGWCLGASIAVLEDRWFVDI